MPSFVDVAGRRVAYETSGDPAGVPVFLLHGTPGSRLERHPDAAAIALTGAGVITYDRPGYGQSDRHPGRTVVDCVPDIAAIADALGVARFAVVGASGGGPHCLAVAARLPDRVLRASCVVGIAPFGAAGLDWLAGMDPENVKEYGWVTQGESVLTAELEREAAEELARVAEDPTTVFGAFDLPDADRTALQHPLMQQMIRDTTAEAYAHGVSGWVDDDFAAVRPWGFDVAEIRVPIEVWYGEDDVLVPASHGRWLADHIPGAEVHVEPDRGHLPDPDIELERLRTFVTAAAAAG